MIALLKLKRLENLHKNIYDFNYLSDNFVHKSWLSDINYQNIKKNMYNDDKDVWLKFASLPINTFYNVLEYAVLILLLESKLINISGKTMRILHQKYSEYKIQHTKKMIATISFDYTLPELNIIQEDNFFSMSGLHILMSAIASTNIAIQTRMNMRFNKNEIVDSKIAIFWDKYPTNTIKNAIISSASFLCANYY